jgi:hypothetical protein
MEYATERKKPASATMRAVPFLAAFALMLALASSARADGRFVYETCDPVFPNGNPPPLMAFHNEPGVSYEAFQTCAFPGGSIGVAQKPNPVGFGWAWLEASIPSTTGGWVESVTLTASSGQFHGNTGHIFKFGRQDPAAGEWPEPGTNDNPRYFLIRDHPPNPALETPAELENAFGFWLACPYGQTCQPGAFVAAHFLAATEVDPTPPVVSGVEGTLVAGDVVRGHQGLRAVASDIGGGVRSLELKVNGFTMPGTALGACSIAAVNNPSYKGIAASSPTPCPPLLSDLWEVDTSAPPFQNGANTVQVCASDLATTGAPNTGCSNLQTIQVDNSCTESTVAGGADLSAGFGDSGTDSLTVGFGSATEIKGTLTNQAGSPISGATICLQSQPAGSTTEGQTVGTVKTDGNGNFSMEIKPGANRQLLVGYRHDSFQIAKKLNLATRARPSIRLDTHKVRGGKRIRISGKLPKPDPGEHILTLQGSSEHGHTWLTFKKVTTDSEGNYSTSYRFTKPQRTTGYRVRVVAPAQAGYEYATGTSKAARIRVRP